MNHQLVTREPKKRPKSSYIRFQGEYTWRRADHTKDRAMGTVRFRDLRTDTDETWVIMNGDPGVAAGIFTYETHPVR